MTQAEMVIGLAVVGWGLAIGLFVALGKAAKARQWAERSRDISRESATAERRRADDLETDFALYREAQAGPRVKKGVIPVAKKMVMPPKMAKKAGKTVGKKAGK